MNAQQIAFNKGITEGNVTNREELAKGLKSFEAEFSENTKNLSELLRQKFNDFATQQQEINKQTTENVKEVKQSVETQLQAIREDNTKQLDEMRNTVDEKLQKTLNERLSQSFETVGKQLQAVQEGLGEMKTLATDVGGLKKVLSNVKMRGGIGEIQLSMLLEQILAPDQYAANVATKESSADVVEFAGMSIERHINVTQTVFLANMGENHSSHLMPAFKFLGAVVTFIFVDNVLKFISRQ